mmetsp:Transcript_75/g.136  ORF Transcript_75/g.136 Transcript_75/m.136 type:complete len:401 (-) Transcript_75:51-1253(-)|eukprot:CAMPEP_0197657532 /NCGR_PEP_ID=MMETSP1338-20131121/44686_1 /TAXON_ID=43686 ORGANISM="Pelagodinium beii, Strain RCC1491" /NCGR_SAMPLE_ID=MMETSP1338 /ASSEMBLY_ACC=CAM_ASM_000754 /LENGTH=400 /DNA_ID=CAMNT_0043233923 /DNA_START=197 /DNA_END=1399 /DNA_ORIENTATION=+
MLARLASSRGCQRQAVRLCLRPRPAASVSLAESAQALPALAGRKDDAVRVPSQAQLYWKLAKGKLTLWVSLSALPGYFLALPAAVDPMVTAALFTGTFLTSSSAQTMNQIIEVKRDSLMKRTEKRPLPTGQLSRAQAVCFATAAGSAGLGILAVGATPATAGIAAVTMATYAGLYTPMKAMTPYNTHVGAISGSLPTVMGFTAALGAGLVASPWAPHAAWLFGMQTLWQMPHFYALAWLHRADYIRGGYTMFPLTDTTGAATAAMSKPYLVALCTMPWAIAAFGQASWMLPVGAFLPSAIWWQTLRNFERKPSSATCRRFFLGSLSYLLAMLALFTAYARVEKPCCKAVAEDDSTDYEPAWRAKMKSYLQDACPHEQVCRDLLGTAKQSGGCPLSRDTPL